MTLNYRQQSFVNNLFGCNFNGTRAARDAGYKHPDRAASRLMSDPKVRAEIESRFEAHHVGVKEIIGRLGEQARGAYGDYIKTNGAVDIERLVEDGKGYLIKSTRNTKQGIDVTFHDPQRAIELIGKHSRLFDDYVEIKLTWRDEAKAAGLTDEQIEDLFDTMTQAAVKKLEEKLEAEMQE
jgi:hypothetical protein